MTRKIKSSKPTQHYFAGRGAISPGKFKSLRAEGRYDFYECRYMTNNRRVKCRVCHCSIPAGCGIAFNEFMTDGYRFSRRYICQHCDELTKEEPASQ